MRILFVLLVIVSLIGMSAFAVHNDNNNGSYIFTNDEPESGFCLEPSFPSLNNESHSRREGEVFGRKETDGSLG